VDLFDEAAAEIKKLMKQNLWAKFMLTESYRQFASKYAEKRFTHYRMARLRAAEDATGRGRAQLVAGLLSGKGDRKVIRLESKRLASKDDDSVSTRIALAAARAAVHEGTGHTENVNVALAAPEQRPSEAGMELEYKFISRKTLGLQRMASAAKEAELKTRLAAQASSGSVQVSSGSASSSAAKPRGSRIG
ncbi:unnamed protein product, partial [Heterosigma akashiwo]